MTRASKSIVFKDFSGGLVSSTANTAIELNQASDLQNINILPLHGFESRRGNSEYNASAIGSSGAVHGLSYFRLSAGTELIVAIAGTKIYTSPLDGTFTDRTGGMTVTTGADSIWMAATLNNIHILVGGPDGTADASLQLTGAVDAIVLAGSAPTGQFVLVSNNRAFIGDINSARSNIQWSILGDPNNWTGTGSGTQSISKNDGDTLVGGAHLDNNHMILFKQNSIHQMITRTSPFPVFELFRGRSVGAVSKRGIVNVNGEIYYITPQPRMKSFNGSTITEYSENINDIWDGLNLSRLKYIQGIYYPKLDQIHWLVSTGTNTTHNMSIIWDLRYKCWLKHPTGFKMNTATIVSDRLLYTGGYAGKIYKQDVDAIDADASETSPGAIDAYWRSGWIPFEAMLNQKCVPYVELNYKTQTSGVMSYRYGYDFIPDTGMKDISMTAPGGTWDQFLWDVGLWGGQSIRPSFVFQKGRGKVFQFLIRKRNPAEHLEFFSIEMPVKLEGVTAMR